MSQTRTKEPALASLTPRRVKFSDDNRARHLETFFKWLPEDFHDTPCIDWMRLPSRVMGYLVNTVRDSPFAVSLAIAAAVAYGPLNEFAVRHRLTSVNCFLQEIQVRCGVTSALELTGRTWETYVSRKELTPADYAYFKAYAIFTEVHLRDYLEKLNRDQYAKIQPHLLPCLPRRFRQQHLPAAAHNEEEKRRRKKKSDIVVPLYTLLVALVRFRKQNVQRLVSAYREALAQMRASGETLPIAFSYEDELVTLNREAQTIADIRLEKRSVTLRFLLWDHASWVQAHPKNYHQSSRSNAKSGKERFAEQMFFVECLNPAEELLWFGDLIQYRLFQYEQPRNITPEDIQQRRRILAQFGVNYGLSCCDLSSSMA